MYRWVGQDLIGRISVTVGQCGYCLHEGLRVRYSGKVTLPKDIEPSTKLILYRPDYISTPQKNRKQQLGITCGCYAKFHRQIAHIEDRMKNR
jgi:hypothetical protein